MDTASAVELNLSWRSKPCASDSRAVCELVSATQVFSEEEVRVAGELVDEAVLKGCAESGYYFQFVMDGNQLAGYSCYGPICLTRDAFDLFWIAVSPHYQGHGLAKELQRRSEDHIRQLGGRQIYAETSGLERYRPAQQFYLRQGYSLLATFPDFYKPGDDKLVYRKLL